MQAERLHFIAPFAIAAARIALLGSLVYAPWAFGSTRDWTVFILVGVLFAALALWVVGRAVQKRLRDTLTARLPARSGIQPGGVPMVVGVASLLLLGLGWSITLNPRAYFDPYIEEFAPVDKAIAWWPGTVDAATSAENMLRISALLLTLLMVTDLFWRTEWRRRLLATIAIVGVTIALFGLAQKILKSPLLFWEPERFSTTNFAMYRYHANAGAYLNLVWPIGAAFAIEAFRRKKAFLARGFWLPATLVLLAAVSVNVSKAAHLVAAGLIVLGVFALIWRGRRVRRRRAGIWLPIAVTAVALVAMVAIIGPQTGLDRWTDLGGRDPLKEGRLWAARACLDMFRAAPWFGFGPGTFAVVFPEFTRPYPILRDGFWRYAHCDYLQTLVEWGVVGAVGFAVVWVGGVARLVRVIVRSARRSDVGGRKPGDRREEMEDGRSKMENGRAEMENGKWKMEDGKSEVGGEEPAANIGPQSSDVRPRLGSASLLDGAVLLALCGMALHAAVDFPLQIASLQLVAVALLGVAWRKPRIDAN